MRRALLLVAALGLGCGPPPRGVEYDGRRLAVVDMHLHPGDWDLIPPATQHFLASRFPFPLNLDPAAAASSLLTADGILAEMDQAGVSAAVLLAIYAPRTVGIASNELVIENLRRDPARLYGLASLRVDRFGEEGARELQRLREALAAPGMIGVKLAHAHQRFRLDDPRYFPIYALAGDLGRPVYLHTGTSPFPGTAQEAAYTDPIYLEEAVRAHPRTRFILGHLGYDFGGRRHAGLEGCLQLARRFPNVFLEPSALGSRGADPDGRNLREALRRVREAGLVDRLIYGSDGPQSPGFVRDYLQRTVAALRDESYGAAEAGAVLADNFARVFGVEPVRP